MQFLTALFVATAFSIVPVLAQSTTTTTTIPFGSRGTRTIVQSSDGSSLTSTTQQFRNGGSYTTRTYVPAPPASSYQPMKSYCPTGNCK
jgi:hypothetical protein